MAQGNLKLKSKPAKRLTKKQRNPKRAAPKILKPLKESAKEAQKIQKSHHKPFALETEKLIAGRVGHLELIKGSRRELEKKEKEKERKGIKK